MVALRYNQGHSRVWVTMASLRGDVFDIDDPLRFRLLAELFDGLLEKRDQGATLKLSMVALEWSSASLRSARVVSRVAL
eukprot:13253895-Alexandrium_andersonii.AAC.1